MSARTETFGIRPAALPAWHALAAALADTEPVPCTGDPEAWWSDRAEIRAYAARACQHCPVTALCRTFADHNRETAGVWAGIDHTPTAGRPAQPKERTA